MPNDHTYRDRLTHAPAKGRGAGINPGNRHDAIRLHVLGDYLDHVATNEDDLSSNPKTTVLPDTTRKIINPVNSPDIHFNWSINPYRGCEHGCAYCYARPDHERLGYSCGLDFETKLIAKFDAPKLLKKELANPKWQPESVMFSGVTDCYQPIEKKYRITRQCLEIFAEANHPVSIVTKNRLILRDIDLLEQLAKVNAARVAISLTTLDAKLCASLEPRASSPKHRLATVRALADCGIPVTVMLAPIIPAINDREIPKLLEAAADVGASNAGIVLLRLPHQLKAVFEDWLHRYCPDRAAHVISLIRQMHGGELYDSSFHNRQHGSGPLAEQLQKTFDVFKKRYNLNRKAPAYDPAVFRRPSPDGQMSLFE